jgi:hypothetical protein
LTATTITENGATVANAITLTTNAGTPQEIADANEFVRTGNNTLDAARLADLINGVTAAGVGAGDSALTTLHYNGYTATASGGVVTITKALGALGTSAAADISLTNVTSVVATTITEALVSADEELTTLVDRYNVMRTQIDELADDSGYKGKNLLAGNTLVVQFEGTTLDVVGFNAKVATDLNISAAAWLTGGSTAIDADILELDAALSTMRQESSKLAGNLSIITVRNDFSTSIINTLIEGSDKLTLADSNEEGANMLMLQTRQTLATTALSLSAQAAQSVLRLFQ